MNTDLQTHAKALVSIAIPTMNRRHDLPTSINSVLNQDYHNIELIISDNGSTDDTPEFCRELAERDPRVKYIRHEENLGLIPNWNYALHASEGKYFMWLGDDDWIEPGTLKTYVDFLEANPAYSLVSGEILYWQEGKCVRVESGLSQEDKVPASRSTNYYGKVIDGAMVYGLCRTDLAKKIEQENGIGPDWHFVAAMAFQGKIKQLNFISYNKVLGGNSASYKRYAQIMGVNEWWGYAPFIKIALDVLEVIKHKYPVYQTLSKSKRSLLAYQAFLGVLKNFYINRYPYIIGGKFLRAIGIKTPNEKRIEDLQKVVKQV
ncbi:MAG: glycosyltransferase family 2 protein [Bacteroidia bacterium]|nr:glycosyltransferase family 2 protein [Bacteroidia bacterium]